MPRPSARLITAQHEAAHIVVGVALGLRLHSATITPAEDYYGYAWFPWGGTKIADSITLAAGVAWERAIGSTRGYERDDLAQLRALQRSASGVQAAVRAAGALLASLGPVHARVTRALLERDLTGADMARLARGERLTVDE
jgi:hypothetical protein